MKTSDFVYDLPQELIAQTPVEPRDASRLLVLNRKNGDLQHSTFRHLVDFLHPGDLLVLNQTRVIPARLYAHKIPTGGRVELLLLRKENDFTWETLVGGKGLTAGKRLALDGKLEAVIIQVLEGSRRQVRFSAPIEPYLESIGHVPLPPYIHTPLHDPERYQTIYAQQPGSAAAPTAGLHFTPDLMQRLQEQGVRFTYVTLHVGLDTFAPVIEEKPEEHHIHQEWCEVTPQAAQVINNTHLEGGRIVAVGTTSVRTLESAAQKAAPGSTVAAYSGHTGLFILPGYTFLAVDAMVTNFHLPESTLIMLVSAFAGREKILHAYQVAVKERYRFYSFGDAMFIF